MDRAWWRMYAEEACKEFRGERLTPIRNVKDAKFVDFKYGGNSGAGAISLAAHYGAEKIILIGYDCQATGGKKHWHGDHPKGLGNAMSMPHWGSQFKEIADYLKGKAEIINATRETALTFWPRQLLEDALNG